jgi:CRISPR-associated exonuclease Cas4
MIASLSDIEGIKGEYFFHYYSCPTRLWLYHRNVSGNTLNEHMRIGDFIDHKSFPRESRKLIIENICAIDFIKEGSTFEIHEVKKGKGKNEAQEMQVLFYMYVMKRVMGGDIRGFIHYPQARKVKEVRPEYDKIETSIDRIRSIIQGECPKPVRIPICRGCSYAEVCWS